MEYLTNLLPAPVLSDRLSCVMASLKSDNSTYPALDPDQWVDRYGDCLYHLALGRLHNPADAEHTVQETFLAAWQSRDTFPRESLESAWLIEILQHTIIDQMRAYYRQNPVTDALAEERIIQDFFEPAGHPKKNPSAWAPDLGTLLTNEGFWEVLEKCNEKLPAAARDAFLLRDVDNIDCQIICEVLNVTQSHLWALLYRARLQIRQCLEINWFENRTVRACS